MATARPDAMCRQVAVHHEFLAGCVGNRDPRAATEAGRLLLPLVTLWRPYRAASHGSRGNPGETGQAAGAAAVAPAIVAQGFDRDVDADLVAVLEAVGDRLRCSNSGTTRPERGNSFRRSTESTIRSAVRAA